MAPTTSISDPTRHIGSANCAIDALLDWTRTCPKHQKAQLFEPDDLLYLLLTLTRIPPTGRTNPYRIPLPHPLHPFDPQSTSICLLTSDSQSAPAQGRIREASLPISTVISLSDLRSDYRPYESRRKLRDSYDLFFADRKILPLLPRLLGKHFFKKKKIPLAVDLSRPGWPEQVRALCGATLLYLRTGTCCAMKVGRVTMGREEVVENLVAAVEGAVGVVPRGWRNVRSMHLKMAESPALPIYEVLPEIGLKIEGVKEMEDVGEVVDEGEVIIEDLGRKGGKKGRIHEVDFMEGLNDEVIEVKQGTKKRKKGKESRVINDVVQDGENNDLSVKKKKKNNGGDDEVEEIKDISAKKRMKKKIERMVEESEKSGDDGVNLSAEKSSKKKKKVKEDGNGSVDGSNKKSKATKLDKKEAKKVKRNKLEP